MSPIDMTEDPEFDFNTDLGNVSNLHTAKGTCLDDSYTGPVRVTLTDGRTLTTRRGQPPDVPAAGIVQQLGTSGQGTELVNNIRVNPSGCSCAAGDTAGLGMLLAAWVVGRRRRKH